MDLLVRDYLLRHTLQQLEEEHGVCARPNATFDKFSLNYDQRMTKPGDKLAEQCRGTIIRPVMQRLGAEFWRKSYIPQLEVLAWPMNRFYNHGDAAAVEIDWSHPSLKVYEKVDGTCIILYWDPLHNKWHCATRSVPEADLPIQSGHLEIGDTTFAELFLKALFLTRETMAPGSVTWDVTGPDKVIPLNKELTYVFELVSPYNQVVVVYPEPRVYLLAARHTQTGKEVPIESLHLEHVLRPRTWEIRDIAALACFVDAADPSQLEGAVACVQVGPSFQRLKVKNKSYVLAHKAKDSVTSSARNALEAVILDRADDIIPLVPADVQDKLRAMQLAFAGYCKQIDARVAEFKAEANGSRKEFAARVMGCGDWTATYFQLFEGRSPSAREWFTNACKSGKLSGSSLDTILSKLTFTC